MEGRCSRNVTEEGGHEAVETRSYDEIGRLSTVQVDSEMLWPPSYCASSITIHAYDAAGRLVHWITRCGSARDSLIREEKRKYQAGGSLTVDTHRLRDRRA